MKTVKARRISSLTNPFVGRSRQHCGNTPVGELISIHRFMSLHAFPTNMLHCRKQCSMAVMLLHNYQHLPFDYFHLLLAYWDVCTVTPLIMIIHLQWRIFLRSGLPLHLAKLCLLLAATQELKPSIFSFSTSNKCVRHLVSWCPWPLSGLMSSPHSISFVLSHTFRAVKLQYSIPCVSSGPSEDIVSLKD